MGSRLVWNTATAMLVVGLTFVLPLVALANPIELTSRPATGDTINWGQLGITQFLTTPQNFTSAGGTTGYLSATSPLIVVQQCCIGLTGTFDGDFAPLDNVLVSPGLLTINFNTPVQSVGAQIQ